MPGAPITVAGLTHRYGSGTGAGGVLDDLALDVEPCGYVAVTGASGADADRSRRMAR